MSEAHVGPGPVKTDLARQLHTIDPGWVDLRDEAKRLFDDGRWADFRRWLEDTDSEWNTRPTSCFLMAHAHLWEAHSKQPEERDDIALIWAEELLVHAAQRWIDLGVDDDLASLDSAHAHNLIILAQAFALRLQGDWRAALSLIEERVERVLASGLDARDIERLLVNPGHCLLWMAIESEQDELFDESARFARERLPVESVRGLLRLIAHRDEGPAEYGERESWKQLEECIEPRQPVLVPGTNQDDGEFESEQEPAVAI